MFESEGGQGMKREVEQDGHGEREARGWAAPRAFTGHEGD